MRLSILLLGMLWGGPVESLRPISLRSYSVEWWTELSVGCGVYSVKSVDPIEGLTSEWGAQNVTASRLESMKGRPAETLTFRHNFPKKPRPDGDVPLSPGNRMLLFVCKRAENGIEEVGSSINLSVPFCERNNACEVLKTEEALLRVVKSRADSPLSGKRGVIVPYAPVGDPPPAIHWDFVRTADPELKQGFLKDLTSESVWSRAEAAFNLVSYPGPETIERLKPLLSDSGENAQPEIPKNYSARAAAYRALTLLGEHPKKPEHYDEDGVGIPFGWGFESAAHFPYGNWKRLSDR